MEMILACLSVTPFLSLFLSCSLLFFYLSALFFNYVSIEDACEAMQFAYNDFSKQML